MELFALFLFKRRRAFLLSQEPTQFPSVQCLSAYCVLCVSHKVTPVPRGLKIRPGALGNAEMPDSQTMGAFRIQVGLDLCGLEQLAKPLRGELGAWA